MVLMVRQALWRLCGINSHKYYKLEGKKNKQMDFANTVLQFLSQGGSAAVIGILFAAVGILIWDRKQLARTLTDTTQKVFDAKDSETKSIKEIVDRYHQGNLDLVEALNEIKIVLITIQTNRR